MVTVSTLGALITIKDCTDDINMILMFMEKWGPAAGFRGCSLVDSERTQVKGLKK